MNRVRIPKIPRFNDSKRVRHPRVKSPALMNHLLPGFCPSNSSPSRKIRKSEGFCQDVDPADFILQLPNVGDISQELLRQKLCSKSQWPMFGNLPVCLEMNRQATPMNSWYSWLIANMDSLESPLTGWMIVPGTLCKHFGLFFFGHWRYDQAND